MEIQVDNNELIDQDLTLRPAAAEKKEEKKEEVEERDMGNLYGGDDDGYWDL